MSGGVVTTVAAGTAVTTTALSHASTTADGRSTDAWHNDDDAALTATSGAEP
jgi:hypothetical protein